MRCMVGFLLLLAISCTAAARTREDPGCEGTYILDARKNAPPMTDFLKEDNTYNPMNINAQYAQPEGPNAGPLTASGSMNPSSDPAANQNAVMNPPPMFMEVNSKLYRKVNADAVQTLRHKDGSIFIQLGQQMFARTRLGSQVASRLRQRLRASQTPPCDAPSYYLPVAADAPPEVGFNPAMDNGANSLGIGNTPMGFPGQV